MPETKKGYVPVMLTPFQQHNGEVDYYGLTELTELYLKAGVTGLFANCLSSEMFELTEEERLQTVKHVIRINGGVVPVVAAGTFGGPLKKQADFIKRMYDTGVHGVVLITGVLAEENESDEILADRVFQLIEMTNGVPLGLYECPVPYKRVLSAVQLKEFVSTGRMVYLKDTSLDIEQVRAKLAAVNGYEFGLYDAFAEHAVESLHAGSAGLSCIQGNFFPEMIVWLCDNYNNPSRKNEVDKVQRLLTANMDVVHHVYPIIAKYFLQKRGVGISTFTRRKVGEFSPKVKADIDKLFEDFASIKRALNISDTGYSF